MKKDTKYSWLEFFEELLNKICTKQNPHSLYKIWLEIFPDKYNNDIDQMDPFSFIGKINSLGDKRYLGICKKLQSIFELKTPCPTDLIGIPRTHRSNPVFFNELWLGKKKRTLNEIMNKLWRLANNLNSEEIDNELLKEVLDYHGIGLSKLTQIFFLCKPKHYFSFDINNRTLAELKYSIYTTETIDSYNSFQQELSKLEPEPYKFSRNARVSVKNPLTTFIEQENKKILKNTTLSDKQKTNATAKNDFTYLAKEITVQYHCYHSKLEKSFNIFLNKIKANNIQQNQEYIDFLFSFNGKNFICELKPSKNKKEIQYAIRRATGQILEYTFHKQKKSKFDYLVIVFQNKPAEKEQHFLSYLKEFHNIFYLREIKNGQFVGNIPSLPEDIN